MRNPQRLVIVNEQLIETSNTVLPTGNTSLQPVALVNEHVDLIKDELSSLRMHNDSSGL